MDPKFKRVSQQNKQKSSTLQLPSRKMSEDGSFLGQNFRQLYRVDVIICIFFAICYQIAFKYWNLVFQVQHVLDVTYIQF